MSAAAALIGSAVARAVGRTIAKTTKKKLAKTVKKKFQSKKANSSVSKAVNAAPYTRPRAVAAPVTVGTSFAHRRARDVRVTIPFNSISNAHIVSKAGHLPGFGTGVENPPSSFAYDLRPGSSRDGWTSLNFPFGQGVARIASCYTRFRLKRLRISYIAVAQTSVPGSILLGVNNDPWTSSSTVTPQAVADCQVSLTTPVWQSSAMDATSLLTDEWYYTEHAGTNTAADQRLQCPLQILVTGIGAPTHDYTIGYLRFDGVIEFTGLSDEAPDFQHPAETERYVSVPQATQPDPNASSQSTPAPQAGAWFNPLRSPEPSRAPSASAIR